MKTFNAKSNWHLIVLFFILGFTLPMFWGWLRGFPLAFVHDELSYLFAADTYANGRLTNPTPPNFEHFEAPHIIVEPSFMSKYPPMQGIFLAFGQVIFGRAIYGVWLSCGLAAASLFFMLSVWSDRKSAIIGTLMMILFIGINGYWAQSYWGGMVAASGGALFLAGFRQLLRKMTLAATVMMTIGGIILINSRPFEGTLTMLPSIAYLVYWLLKDRGHTTLIEIRNVIIPGVLLSAIAIGAMGYNNYKVTGNITTLPYSIHQKQYFVPPLFVFQSENVDGTRGNPRLRRLYDRMFAPGFLMDFFKQEVIPNYRILYPVYALIYLFLLLPTFYLSPVLLIFLYISLFLSARKNPKNLFILGTIIFTFFGMSFASYWENAHYSASLMCCFYLLLIEGFKCFYPATQRRALAASLIALMVICSFVYMQMEPMANFVTTNDFLGQSEIVTQNLANGTPVILTTPEKVGFSSPKATLKQIIEDGIEKLPYKYIALVKYDENFPYLDEIVYNKSDLENAKLIWANDLGDAQNSQLLRNYPNRRVLSVSINSSQLEIIPEIENIPEIEK